MASAKVFIFAAADATDESHRMLEQEGCDLVIGKAGWETPRGDNEEEMRGMARGAHALIGTSIRSSPISRRIMMSSPELRVVSKYTIGVDDIDVDAATELGILVTHAPTESNWGAVAEGTIAMMLMLLRRLRQRDEQVKAGRWRDPSLTGTYLGSRASDGYPGITIGIIGMGRIGRRVSNLLRPWNLRFIGYDPYVSDDVFTAHNVTRVELPALLSTSDVVTLHVVLTPETRNLIAAPQLALMKPSAVLVNTSRGGVVDEDALAAALRAGKLDAAALDVFAEEPLQPESPLRPLGNRVLLSPHMVSANAGGGLGGLGEGVRWATESVLAALRGQVPDHVYNQEAIPQWQERFLGRAVLAG
ncbi:MAG: hypothetical protein EXR51_09225 [Dehalococcoidia bacterium]|nr:hypothetical protein [Dehalococcoidia bacterium]